VKAMLAACALLVTGHAAAMERVDLGGLRVSVVPVPGVVNVDGVAMQLSMATGRDVERLAARIEARWRAEGSLVQRHQAAGWQVLSRLEQGRSEVVQWTGDGASARLLHSKLDAMRAPTAPAAPPFRLPAACAWGRVISGTAESGPYEQRTAICGVSPAASLRSLRERLAAQHWVVLRESDMNLEVARAGTEARLVVAPGPGAQQSTVVWLAVPAKEVR
jgi:hypothetical protein